MDQAVDQPADAAPPRVTVVINCYNGEAYLDEAVRSVISQSFDDWELLLYDDCSTDGSATLFKRYDDPRFRYLRAERRRSLRHARHAAILNARADWVAFLDQDDIWLPDKLARQMAIAETATDGTLGLIYGRATRFGYHDEGEDFDHHFSGRPLPEGRIFEALATEANFVAMSSAVIYRPAYLQLPPVPEFVQLCPDLYFWLALTREWNARAVQTPCCLYRVGGAVFGTARGTVIFGEYLRILEHFAGALDARVMRRRLRVHQSLLGVAELSAGQLVRGIMRIVRRGSPAYLARRAPRVLQRWLGRRFSRR